MFPGLLEHSLLACAVKGQVQGRETCFFEEQVCECLSWQTRDRTGHDVVCWGELIDDV